jgi:hypothetical protein
MLALQKMHVMSPVVTWPAGLSEIHPLLVLIVSCVLYASSLATSGGVRTLGSECHRYVNPCFVLGSISDGLITKLFRETFRKPLSVSDLNV